MRRGLTLVELVISVGIIALLTLLMTDLFIRSSRFTTDEQSRIQAGVSASRVLSVMDSTIRQGKAVLTSTVFNSTTYTSSDTVLVISIPSTVSGNPSPTLVDTVIYYYNTAEETIHEITVPNASSSRAAGDRVITTDVKDMYFRYTADTPSAAQAVTVTAQTSETSGGKTFIQTSIIHAALRNHP